MIASEDRIDQRATLGDYVALMKPRIDVLLLVTGFCAMIVAAHGLPSWQLILATMLGLGMSSGGAHAVNMWYDRDIDALMERTSDRPLPSGRMQPNHALIFGVALEIVSFALLGFLVNWLTAALSLTGFIYYVFIYTMWLKRRTPQNIVIGGGAGAFPPLIGWAAVSGRLELAAILMFLIIFMWTPPHFWALALYRNEDYKRAHIPMMPVVRGPHATKLQVIVYILMLIATSLLLYWTHTVGLAYLAAAILLGAGFLYYGVRVLQEHAPNVVWARGMFRYSLVYLGALFFIMVLNVHAV